MDNRNTPPGKVSPFIKGARWSFLLLGVVYGASRYSRLNKLEQVRLAEFEKTRPEREAKAKMEKEMSALAVEQELVKAGFDMSSKSK